MNNHNSCRYDRSFHVVSCLALSNNINNNNNNFIYIALKSNNCPKRYLIGTTKYSLHEERNDLEYVLKFKRSEI